MIKKYFNPDEKVQAPEQREVIPARCSVTGEDFSISLGYEKGKLTMLEGKKTDSISHQYTSSSHNKGFKTMFRNNNGNSKFIMQTS